MALHIARNALHRKYFSAQYVTSFQQFKQRHDTSGIGSSQGIIYSDAEPVALPNSDLCSFFFPLMSKWHDKEALECVTTGKKYTYGELKDVSLKFGGALQHLRQKFPIKRVSMFSPNVIEYPVVTFGAVAMGCDVTTISSYYTAHEVANQLEDSTPDVLIVDPSLEGIALKALELLKKDIPIIVNGTSSKGYPNLQEILQDPHLPFAEPVQCNPSDNALILYSSGTSGRPKGVVLQHSALTNNITCMKHKEFMFYGDMPHDSRVVTTPFYHSFGMCIILLPSLSLGSKVILYREFDPNKFGKTIRDGKVQYLHVVPSLVNFALNSPLVARSDLEHLRGILVASAPMSPSVAVAFKEKCPNPIFIQEGYGLTETLATLVTPVKEEQIGYCGKPISHCQIKMLDVETKLPVAPGEPGEIYIKGTANMKEYLNNPKETKNTVGDDGFLKSGDVGIYKEDHFFKIVDRVKELIKVKGFQVSPAEVEDVLMGHSAVIEAAVVGYPDSKSGQLPRAYITTKGKVTKEELHKYVAERLATYKHLKGGIIFVDSLPHNRTGKVLRRQLQDMAIEDYNKFK